MRQESIVRFEEQIFRQIGYSVGLERILEFYKVCLLFQGKGSLGERELQLHVAGALKTKLGNPIEESVVEGKINVSRVLGLIFSPQGLRRYALTPHGRALVAITKLVGPESAESRAFFLRRIIESDADLSLTLLAIFATGNRGQDLDEAFPTSLNSLLLFKRDRCRNSALPLSMKDKVTKILTVHESKPRRSLLRTQPISFGKSTQGAQSLRKYETFEILEPDIPTYVRHVTDPRKGWLVSVGILERGKPQYAVTSQGRNLLDFLQTRDCLANGFVVIQPDEDVLLDLIGQRTLLANVPVNNAFYADLISYTYTGHLSEQVNLTEEDFLHRVIEIYPLVKLETFEQAETAAIRECLETSYWIKGQKLEFDALLESTVKRFPARISRMSSRHARGAYISLKGQAI